MLPERSSVLLNTLDGDAFLNGWPDGAPRPRVREISPYDFGNLDSMPIDGGTAIAYTGAFVGLLGGAVALFNARKAVCWKRAELANTYMKDFNNNAELVFAGRCLD